MQSHHWLMLLIVFLIGYAAARLYPQLGHTVGLP
jgi:hypothetical protein